MYDLIKNEGLAAAMRWYHANGKKAAWGRTDKSVAKQILKERVAAEGLALMESDLKETPTKVSLILQTAKAHLENGQPKKALEYAEKGIDQKPDDPGLREIKSEAKRAVRDSAQVDSLQH